MKPSKYSWVLPDKINNNDLLMLMEQMKLPRSLTTLFESRGLDSEAKINEFLYPNEDMFHNPFLMNDMQKAVERIQIAIENGDSILIYGDYDADGITSTVVMKEALEMLGADVQFYLPNRFKDGYGPNQTVYAEFIEQGISLIITVDNGIAGYEAITYAQSEGVDVIVTDHHEIPEELPNAYAIVHPRHPNGNYPFGDLAGVGVSFKVASALLGEIPSEMLDVVAIGTIADLVTMKDENRALVKWGLDALRHTERIGLLALCDNADVNLSTVDEETVGFSIAPRLNALGRIADASPGVTLLTTFDEEIANSYAELLQSTNVERQELVKQISKEALEMVGIQSNHSINILAKVGWHEGVLGIVASKLVEKTGKPTLVLTIDAKTGVAKGSGRSTASLNFYTMLSDMTDLFLSFGGHHMAAGLSLPSDYIVELQDRCDQYILDHAINLSEATPLSVDMEIAISDVTEELIKDIRLLAPFGEGNPAPKFLISPQKVKQVKAIGADNAHLKFQLSDGNSTLDAIFFGKGPESVEFTSGGVLKVIGKLSLNEWNGKVKPQMMVEDYRVEGTQVFDFRGKQYQHSFVPTLSIIFNPSNRSLVRNTDSEVLVANEIIESSDREIDSIHFVDCPIESTEVSTILKRYSPSRISVSFTSKEQSYMEGMVTRDQFAQFFKFISGYNNIDVRHKTKSIAQYLGFSESFVIFMIQVFEDLNFVIIEDGIMNKVENPEQHELTESITYQNRLKQMKTEELLLYTSFKELREWILKQEEEER